MTNPALATITLDFDPFLHLGDSAIRIEALAIAASVLLALVVAALTIVRIPVHDPHAPAWAVGVEAHLRRDDLLFIVLGAIPGAVVGGRIGYVLLHLDYYSAHPSAIADPAQGSLELGLAAFLGLLSAAYVARLLDAPVGRWLHGAAIPTFLAIALGELGRVLGGGGQGSEASVPWAVSFAGVGPWGSLVPGTPAHPAQVYDALAAGVAVLVVVIIVRSGGFRSRDGSAFFFGLLIWSLGRFAATFAWRDDAVLGPIRAGGLIALGLAVVSLVGIALCHLVGRRARRQAHERPEPEPTSLDWPDPVERPKF